jgi:hypothetical protein
MLIQARALAEDRLAAIRLSPYDDLVRLPDSLARGRFDPPFEAYEWNATSREMRDEMDLFDVSVVVTWSDGAFRLETRVSACRLSSGALKGRVNVTLQSREARPFHIGARLSRSRNAAGVRRRWVTLIRAAMEVPRS